MTATVRTLILSHVVLFAAGFAAGKIIDRDELQNYRSAHESSFTKYRRKLEKLALGTVVIGTVVLVARAATRSSKSN